MTLSLRSVRWPAFAVIAAAGLFVCFWHLGRQGIVTDESAYVGAGWGYVHGVFTANLEHPPTAKYLYGVAQLVMGQGYLGPRVVAATATFATGLVLFAWLLRPLGFWGALLAAGLWWLGPRGNAPDWMDPASGSGARVDRLALLEPVMVFFAVSSLAAGWAWIRTRSRWRFAWAALAGGALGLAVTSKVTSAVLVVALIALPLLFRRWWDLLVGGVVAAAGFAVAFVAVYQPVGMVRAVSYMFEFQAAHDAEGHLVEIAGRSYPSAPWWANLYFLAHGITVVLLVVLVVGIVAALVVRPGRLVAYLGIAIVALGVFLCTARVALPHYYDIWMPFLTALAAVGYTALWRTARARRGVSRRDGVVRAALSAVVVVALLASLFPVTQEVVRVARTRPAGIALLQHELDAHGASGTILFSSYGPPSWRPYFAGHAVSAPVPGRFGAIVQGTDARFPMPDEVRAFIRTNHDGLEHFDVDQLRVWVPRDGVIEIGADRTMQLTR